jgi:8-oxo-dGTP diphosphatase
MAAAGPTRRSTAPPAKAADAPDFPRPLTTVDLVIFTVRDEALQLLLVRRAEPPFAGQWALPGGFVDIARDADLQACASRKLREKAGVQSPYLEQLGSWGGARRDPRGWSATHAYMALIPTEGMTLRHGANASDAAWFEADELLAGTAGAQPLAFDHEAIVRAGVERLRSKVEYTSLPAFLLPEPFTLPELQRAYEVVLGRPVDKSGFRTRMLAGGFLVEAGLVPRGTRRPPMGYRLASRDAPVVFPRTFGPRGAG